MRTGWEAGGSEPSASGGGLLTAPQLTALVCADRSLGGVRYVGEVVHYLRPLSVEDGARLLALALGSQLRSSRLNFERACELASAAGREPGRIVSLVASMRAAAHGHAP